MSILDLWLPILLSGIICFAASSVIWVVIKWHNSDYRPVEREEDARAALTGAAPGFYVLPYCVDFKDMEKPEMKQKFDDGPIAYITVNPNGMPHVGRNMLSMFIYFIVIGIFAAYMVSRTLAPDAEYLAVFRIAGTVAFIANAMAVIPESVWFGRPWSMTFKNIVDALAYGLLTGGVFGWLA